MIEVILEGFESGAWGALKTLGSSAFVFGAYAITKGGIEGTPSLLTYGKALLLCALLAAFAAAGLGEPSCAYTDPIHGGCQEYQDDGFQPSRTAIYEHFAKIFLIFFVPAAYAISEARKEASSKELLGTKS